MKFSCLLVFVALLGLAMAGKVAQITINNAQPRNDTSGNIMDIHDGNVLIIDNVYYWYGASYGNCKEPAGSNGCANVAIGACGFQTNHNVSLYTSPDLGNWTFMGFVFSATAFPSPTVLFCPKVIYNKPSGLYVMWVNYINGSFANSFYAAAVSPSPLGPFKLVTTKISTGYADTGDFNLFADPNTGDAYVIYTAHIQGNYALTHQMSVEKLTPDFLGTEGLSANSGFFGQWYVEAPAMFYDNGIYYAVFGACCCYCQSGSPVYVHTATNPLGPYTNITTPITSAIPAQQTNIMPYYSGTGKIQYLWMGDRWQSAPDGIKGHDFVYIGQIVFNGTTIEPIPFDSKFILDVYIP
jgi:sucrose-6-phosphate hydrolase SacC (GH32 family)